MIWRPRFFAFLLLAFVAAVPIVDAQQISAISVTHFPAYSYPATFDLRVLDGAPRTVVVSDAATGEPLATLSERLCTRANGCPKPGVLYGPDEYAPWTPPPGSNQPPDPRFWGVWGYLSKSPTPGQVLNVSIDGRMPIKLRCLGSSTPWANWVGCSR